MKKIICFLCLVFSIILCSCSVQKSDVLLNSKDSSSNDKVYDIHYSQNNQINIVVYEYLNGEWNEIISEFLESDTQKIVVTLHDSTLEDSHYDLQISYQDHLSEDLQELQQITFQAEDRKNNLIFHSKAININKINKKLQNLVIYEWIDNNENMIYDLENFSMDDSYNAKRAYLVMISSSDKIN